MVEFLFFVILSVCLLQDRSLYIVTPEYFASVVMVDGCSSLIGKALIVFFFFFFFFFFFVVVFFNV